MIEATGLGKVFDTFHAVRDVSLCVEPGELLALLGPNGAGKTTTVRMLGAILRPSDGWARINGYDIVHEASMVRRSIGMLTEQPGLYPRMNGLEYLTFYGRLYGLTDAHIRRRTTELFERFAMPDVMQRRLGAYSKGMRQKVGLMRAMLHDPPVLLLDEPTSAMDPYSARLVRDAIHLLRQGQRSIILCTHNLAEAEELADRIAIISQGKIVCVGTASELKKRLLGTPVYELRLTGEPGEMTAVISTLVEIEHVQGTTIRYRTAQPQVKNPDVVKALTDSGLGIVSLTQLTQSLEEVYLAVLGEQAREMTAEGTR